MPGDGTIGGDGRFPETRWSAVTAVCSGPEISRRSNGDCALIIEHHFTDSCV